MSEMKLVPNEKINVENILKDLESYRPKRRGWTSTPPDSRTVHRLPRQRK